MHSWGLDHSSRAQKNAILQFEHCSRIFIYDETFYFHVSLRHNFGKYFFFFFCDCKENVIGSSYSNFSLDNTKKHSWNHKLLPWSLRKKFQYRKQIVINWKLTKYHFSFKNWIFRTRTIIGILLRYYVTQ